jgi:uncharacterized membrane protein YkoI
VKPETLQLTTHSPVRRLLAAALMFVLTTGLTAVLAVPDVHAQPPANAPGMQYDPDTDEDAEPGPVNQRQALERVRARFVGNVISVNEITENGVRRFRFRLDNEGSVYTVYVDRSTGRVSRE